jgi:hypothetical protein
MFKRTRGMNSLPDIKKEGRNMYYIPEEQPRSGSCGLIVLLSIFGVIVLIVLLSVAGSQVDVQTTDVRIADLENEVVNLHSMITVLEREYAQALAELEIQRQTTQLAQAEAAHLTEMYRQFIANVNIPKHLYIPNFQVGAGLPVGSNIGGGSVDPVPSNLPKAEAQPEPAKFSGLTPVIQGLLASVVTAVLVIFLAVGAALWRQR